MFLKYGSYQHAIGEGAVTIARTPIHGEQGYRTGYKETWNISGRLEGATQALVTTEINKLIDAYSVDGNDIGLYLDSGTASAHRLISADSSTGVQIIEGPSFPVGDGAQYSTFRDYAITVEAEFNATDDDSQPEDGNTISWVETVSITGSGGPDHAVIQTINGIPPIQRLNDATPVRARQFGTAVGRLRYPFWPPPLWPDAEKPMDREITRKGPVRQGPSGKPTFVEWELSWSYGFEWNRPLIGKPRAGYNLPG